MQKMGLNAQEHLQKYSLPLISSNLVKASLVAALNSEAMKIDIWSFPLILP